MTADELAGATRAYADLLSNVESADAAYDEWAGFHEKPIVSTDLARLLCPVYRDAPPGTLRELRPSWDHAWRYAQDRFERELRHRRGRKLVRFMAGGWAAGKTHALRTLRPADLAWDGTLGDTEWADRMIGLAVSEGWKVQIAYVQRPIQLAMAGALERAGVEGRAVPLWKLPANHAVAQRSIVSLFQRWEGDKATFRFFYNSGTIDSPTPILKLSISDIAEGGQLWFSNNDLLAYQRYAADFLSQARQTGHFREEVLSAAAAGMGGANDA